MTAQLEKIDKQVSQFLERILDTSVPSVITAYEERIQKLELEKRVIKEKAVAIQKPANTFEDALRTALEFLSNLLNLWGSQRLEDKKAVLKLAFSDRLEYSRGKRIKNGRLYHSVQGLRSILGDKCPT